MGGVMAIMWRELTARRDLLWLAVAVVAGAFLLPYLPGIEGPTRTELWETASMFCALAVGYLLAVGLGATTFGADLSEGRLGFFFARPVNGASIWVGRITAVVTLVLVSELISLIPVAFIRPVDIQLLTRFGWWILVPFVVAPVVLVLLAHAVSMMARARTAWLLLDVIGFMAAAVVVWAVLRPLVLWGNHIAVWAIGLAFAAAAIAALALAGAAGVVFGRTDLRRVHGALSLALWISLAAFWAGVASYGHWLNDFGPRDLGEAWLEKVDPTGTWAVVGGTAPSRLDIGRRFIVSMKDRRYVTLLHPLTRRSWNQRRPMFSDSGEVAAWFVDERKDRPQDLWWVDLTAGDTKPVQTTITSPQVWDFDLSSDGSRILIATREGLVSVYDLVDESLVSMARLPEGLEESDCSFVDETTIRCQLDRYFSNNEEEKWRVAEIDIDTGEVSVTGEIELSKKDSWPRVTDTRSSLRILSDCPGENCRLRLHDPRTGALQEERPLPKWATNAYFLKDGRLFASQRDWPRTLAVGLEDADTGLWTIHEFDESPGARVGQEVLPAQLVIFDLARDPLGRTTTDPLELFNLETGETRSINPGDSEGGGLGELDGAYWRSNVPVEWEPGVWHLLFTTHKGLVRWDPETDELVTIAGGAG